MIAYTAETGPLIWPSVDYINVSVTLFQSVQHMLTQINS